MHEQIPNAVSRDRVTFNASCKWPAGRIITSSAMMLNGRDWNNKNVDTCYYETVTKQNGGGQSLSFNANLAQRTDYGVWQTTPHTQHKHTFNT